MFIHSFVSKPDKLLIRVIRQRDSDFDVADTSSLSDLLEIAHKGILLIRSYIPQQENRFDGKACSIDR
jgi:uncharacterized protein YqeY